MVIKRSVKIAGHPTSISIEDIFWNELKAIAKRQNTSLQKLITAIDKKRQGNLSSALRIYVVKDLQSRAG